MIQLYVLRCDTNCTVGSSASGASGVITTDLFKYLNYALDCVIHMVNGGPDTAGEATSVIPLRKPIRGC